MLNFKAKKNVIYYSIDSRRTDLYSVYNGCVKTPNLERMAKQSLVFNNMYSVAASTVMSLSSIINGRWCHEFDRSLYPEVEPHHFDDNLFSDAEQSGRTNYILFNDEYLDFYANGIYRGSHAERVRANYKSPMDVTKHIVDIAQSATEPYTIYFHASLGFPRGGKKIEEEDEALGYLLENIDLNDTTLIVYADHGFLKGEHANLFFHAFFPYKEVLNVPCLISSDTPAVIDDFYSMTQLRDIIGGKTVTPQKYLYADTAYRGQRHRITSVHDTQTNWKYVAHYSHRTSVTGRQEELYDLNWDPGEHRNLLFDRSQHPIRTDWNGTNLGIKFGLDDYKLEDIQAIVQPLRTLIANIWTDGFLTRLKEIENDPEYSAPSQSPGFSQRFLRLEPQKQMALISRYFDSENSHEADQKRNSVTPLGYPSLPKSFLEYAS